MKKIISGLVFCSLAVFRLAAQDTVIVGPNVQIFPSDSVAQLETTIAVDPADPNRIFVGAITDWISRPINYWVFVGAYISTDGGQTWSGSNSLQIPTNPNELFTDPSVGIFGDGTVVYSAFRYHQLSATTELFVTYSNDGTDWSEPSIITTTTDTGGSPDKGHLAINQSSYPVTHAWTRVRGRRYDVYSNIGGKLSGDTLVNLGVNLAYSPTGNLYAVWTNWAMGDTIRKIKFAKATGGVWNTPIDLVTGVIALGDFPFKGKLIKGDRNNSTNYFRVNNFPSMAVDNSSGLRRGYIYVVWADQRNGTPDIFCITGIPFGSTINWQPIQRVNTVSTNDQWSPWCTVDPATGILYIVYYDSRNFPNNDSVEVYVSYSDDGGSTFTDVKVSDRAFHLKPPRTYSDTTNPAMPKDHETDYASGVVGDYIGIAANEGFIYPCWNDDRIVPGRQQVYVAKIIHRTPVTFTNKKISSINLGGNLFVDNNDTVVSGQTRYYLRGSSHIVKTLNE